MSLKYSRSTEEVIFFLFELQEAPAESEEESSKIFILWLWDVKTGLPVWKCSQFSSIILLSFHVFSLNMLDTRISSSLLCMKYGFILLFLLPFRQHLLMQPLQYADSAASF